jgi:hypothetical protein
MVAVRGDAPCPVGDDEVEQRVSGPMIKSQAERSGLRSGLCRRSLPSILVLTGGVLLSMGCGGQNPGVSVAQIDQGSGNPSESSLVECVIPGHIRRLNRRVVHLSASQKVQTSASECEVRGGSWRDSGEPAASLE